MGIILRKNDKYSLACICFCANLKGHYNCRGLRHGHIENGGLLKVMHTYTIKVVTSHTRRK